ncbi:hypothetical protein MPH_04315 [Macrophomina phaseolina MS6]|uniref:Uncharacterized protein n=1 Tax=Macrophomina phaseolina (strain MS6) TaxID=1126212 RepID=K2RUR1_MACPH|nr:hypothetical protein MPH_04315 [Macrophomina phaseolina MS6]
MSVDIQTYPQSSMDYCAFWPKHSTSKPENSEGTRASATPYTGSFICFTQHALKFRWPLNCNCSPSLKWPSTLSSIFPFVWVCGVLDRRFLLHSLRGLDPVGLTVAFAFAVIISPSIHNTQVQHPWETIQRIPSLQLRRLCRSVMAGPPHTSTGTF